MIGRVVLYVSLLALSACSYERGSRGTTEEDTIDESITSANASSPVGAYEVFLENSGSMDGYVQGITTFEDDIYKLLVDMGYAADTLNLYYINSKPIPYTGGVEKFINRLEPAEFKQRGGNRSNSDLNQILQEVLDYTQQDQVTVLISDFIFSLKGEDTEALLNNQQISLYNTFRRKLEQEAFATLIVKMHSDFTGNYYTKDNRPVYLSNVQRPYYFWLMGPADAIQSALTRLKIQQLGGFDHSYTLLPTDQSTTAPFYTVLNNTFRKGSFRTDRAQAGQGYVHGIENPQASSRDDSRTFQFSVAVNLSGIAADASYLSEPNNYQVSGYQLDTIMTIEQMSALHPRDQAMVEDKATHVLVFSTQGNNLNDLQVALKKQTPAWVQQTSSTDDTAIKQDQAEQDKTFGFRYLVAGVEEAYWNVFGREAYFTLEVSVKR